uniref:Uncharacterized protein n=1 Tax=Oryza rufipogon TaxID=4529 RepID=A0A0E0NTB9_ORYRU
MSSVAFIKVSRRTKIGFSPDNTTRERGTSRQRSQKGKRYRKCYHCRADKAELGFTPVALPISICMLHCSATGHPPPSSVSARTLLNQYRSACSIALPQAILGQCEDIAEPMLHAILRQREDIAEPTPLVSINARTSLNQCPSPVSCRRPLRHTTFTGLPDATTSSHVVGWATSLLSPALTSQCYRLDCA